MQSSIPISLYIHIPWCVRKCPYCDFNSHPQSHSFNEPAYVEALLKDIDYQFSRFGITQLHSVFFGGGTPSLFSANAITTILEKINSRLAVKDIRETTLETNPGTFEADKFAGYLAAGINRLSIGVQSFNDSHLQALGRIHSGQEARHAIKTARQIGFDNINVDIMFGLPDQSETHALQDLQQAMDMSPDHISWYQLTIEPNTAFYAAPPVLPEHEAIIAMHSKGIEMLETNHYKQYEVSAYARNGKTCLHNLNYWQFGDYLGIGAGAHGKLTLPDPFQVSRTTRAKHPNAYIETIENPTALVENPIEKENLMLEFMMNALRLKNGVETGLCLQRTGASLEDLKSWAKVAVDNELIKINENKIQTTGPGYLHLNTTLMQLMN
jgi:oxygen-independent coproporphyrinogen-3 oxidase